MPKRINRRPTDEEALIACQEAYGYCHKAAEERAKFETRKHLRELMFCPDTFNVSLEDWKKHGWTFKQRIDYDRKLKKKLTSKQSFVWVTLNFDNKKITPPETIPIVKRFLYHSKVTKGFAVWEWRTNEGTGLHAHLALQGDTGKIVQFCKRQNNRKQQPYIKLVHTKQQPYRTLMLKNIQDDWDDYLDYLKGDTSDSTKNELKSSYPRLREKFNLPNLTNNM